MPQLTVPQALGLAFRQHQAGRLIDAESTCRQILALQPECADALHLLGLVAHQLGRHELALERISAAVALRPNDPTFHSNLGEVYRKMGRLGEAIGSFRRALELRPEYALAYLNLGSSLVGQGQFDEAITAFRRALEITPNIAIAHFNLGNVLMEQGKLGEAISAYRHALELDPVDAETWNNLGLVLGGNGQLDEAVAAFQRALEIRPDFALVYNNLGDALCNRGEVDEAIAAYRRAIALRPEQAWIYSNLVYTLEFQPGRNGADIAAAQRLWRQQFEEPCQGLIMPPANDRNPDRRLRVGYVSPHFRDHVIGRNLWPLFQWHDSGNFEIVCYSAVTTPDQFTRDIQMHTHGWRSIIGATDEALVEMVRRDEIDILVDLSQHAAGNRLTAFARKPAPVQVSFAGYPESTGLEAMRYRISDRWLEGVENEEGRRAKDEGQPEERVCLIDSFWCYDPRGDDFSMEESAGWERRAITFCNLNDFGKTNRFSLRLWARVLTRVKDSRLILLSSIGGHRDQTIELLEREGVQANRVEFAARRPRRDYLRLYEQMDIALDPFPYGGHTTSLDALWMGVPVVSLAGERPVSRGGLSILNNLGLPELVTFSEDEYVDIAVNLATDQPRLAELRHTLRSRMEKSVLMNGPHFARQIEAAYRAMWRDWCARPEQPSSPVPSSDHRLS